MIIMTEVYIILLNWNGWKDTVQCLESLFRGDYPHFRVIVCDNKSSDGSMEKIKAWAEGKLAVDEKINQTLKSAISPPIKKPVMYVRYNQAEAENGGKKDDEEFPLVLIQNNANRGFSAGNNVGIRYALKKGAAYTWLLNNDTLVLRNTLKELVHCIQSDEAIGLVGSVIYFSGRPSEIQTYGGGKILPLLGLDRFARSPGRIHYVSGTSLFIKREVLEQTGLLDEGFFFYWEDVDFSRRALKKGWKPAVCGSAFVYHKFSASVEGQSLKSDLFKAASLALYFKKHYKVRWILPVAFNILGMVINRLLRGQFSRIFPILSEVFTTTTKGPEKKQA